MKHSDHRWVDFAIGDVRARNHVVDIREALAAREGSARENSYITVYRFPAEYRAHLERTGTVSGYSGTAYADYLPFDIDRAGNLQQALGAALALGHTLQDRFDVRSDQVRYFFSGAKGFHLLVPTALFGDVEPSSTLPQVFRELALRIASDAGEEIDRVIYDQNRLFRLPGTKHPSGLWKVELSWGELCAWTTDQVRFAARTRRDFAGTTPNVEPIPALADLFSEAVGAVENRPTTKAVAAGGLASAICRAVDPYFREGQRHSLVIALAGYAAKRHVPRETMLGVADELLIGARNVADPSNLSTAINDTYDRVRAGTQVKGYSELAQLMAAADLVALAELLGDTRTPQTPPAEKTEPEPAGPEFDVMLGDVLDGMSREKQEPIDATPTPWPLWNAACRGAGGGTGIARGWHVIVAARSGNGKSLLGANMAVSAIRAGERAAIISLEMAQIEMQTRVMAIVGKQKINALDHGPYFQAEAWSEAKRRMHGIYEETGGKLYINRRPMSTLGGVGDAIRSLYEREGVRWFVVDYLQLAAVGVGRMSDLLDRITEVSFMVRGLAKELRVTTVGMSQLNRETSKSKEKPSKEGLMGGSPLENDAEQVLLLDHSRIIRESFRIKSWALLDKNRHGELLEIPTSLSTNTLEIAERLPDDVEAREVA
jgi:KaiC/GvpD/RAD55 family RecA-like ATPase